jgi:ketosteroid isomerase-like protein
MQRSISALVLVAATVSAFALQSADVKKAIELKEKQFISAFRAKDISWFQKCSTADFVAYDQHGKKYTKEQAMAQMSELFQVLKVESVSSSVKSIKMQGKDVLVVTETTLKGTIPNAQGKTSKLVDVSSDEELWVKSGSDWKIKVDRTKSDKATLDGKPAQGM